MDAQQLVDGPLIVGVTPIVHGDNRSIRIDEKVRGQS
jgi:hypothetical protein